MCGRGGGVRQQGLVCDKEDKCVNAGSVFLEDKIAVQPFWHKVHIGLLQSRKPFCPGSTPMAVIF